MLSQFPDLPTQQTSVVQPVQAPMAPPPPTYPQTRVDVQEQGVFIYTDFTPNLTQMQFISEDNMNLLAGRWLETRRELKKKRDIVHDIKRTNTPH